MRYAKYAQVNPFCSIETLVVLQQCPYHYLYIPSGMCCPLICCRYDNDWSKKSQQIKEAKYGKRMSAIEETSCL